MCSPVDILIHFIVSPWRTRIIHLCKSLSFLACLTEALPLALFLWFTGPPHKVWGAEPLVSLVPELVIPRCVSYEYLGLLLVEGFNPDVSSTYQLSAAETNSKYSYIARH